MGDVGDREAIESLFWGAEPFFPPQCLVFTAAISFFVYFPPYLARGMVIIIKVLCNAFY